jgi:GntR family histidine utilization transcriptional repressor
LTADRDARSSAGSTAGAIRSWQSVRDEVRRRISIRQWKPGDAIPGEAELSREFGCARATVNRALRSLAQAGLLDRRRKAGTRVALHPVRKATLDIPVIRIEIEGKGMAHGYRLLRRALAAPPPVIGSRMQAPADAEMLHVTALHLADDRPYVLEDRWISPTAAPEALDADFSLISANEWLVAAIPFEGGDIEFTAIPASSDQARALECREGEALFAIHRTTWSAAGVITCVNLTFAPGYRMRTQV